MTIALTKELLQSLCPRPKSGAKGVIWDGYVEAMTSPRGGALLNTYGVTTKLRLAHFLAQVLHESGALTIVYESGAYSAKRIMQIFGQGRHTAAVTPSEAAKLAGNGYALFERVYGLGNPRKARELGNRQAGDGFNFRGTGLIQTTGRGSHEEFTSKIGCPLDKLCEPLNSLNAALLEWDEKKCNAAADKDDIKAVTRGINGGQNGLAERRTYLAKAIRLLDAVPGEPKKPKLVTPPRATEEVAVGDDNTTVKELQELLVRAGYIVPVDGKMGAKTEAALAGFQVNHGLPATGQGDAPTWEALRAAKPPAPRAVDVNVLAEQSRIVSLGLSLKNWFSWGYRSAVSLLLLLGSYLGFGDESTPIDVVDKASATAAKANDLATQLNLPVGLTDWRVWAFVILAVVGIICLFGRKKSQGIVAARVEDAQTGANLSA